MPPLRAALDVEALIQGLKDDVIDVISSGHAPHAPEEKQLEFVYAPPGVVGLETLFAVSYTVLVERHGFSLLKLLEKMTIQPARILRLSSERGSLEPGKFADISVFDITRERAITSSMFQSKSRNTCFDGWKVRGTTQHVFVSGKCVVRAGEITE